MTALKSLITNKSLLQTCMLPTALVLNGLMKNENTMKHARNQFHLYEEE